MVCCERSNWVDWKKWEEVRSICMTTVRTLARESDETARELSNGFVIKMMCTQRAQKAKWPFDQGTREWLGVRAMRFVRMELERRRYDRKHFVPGRRKTNDEAGGDAEVIYDLPDKRPGPEYLAVLRDVLYMILREINTEKPAAKSAFIGRVLQEKRFTDMAKATGKTENSLWLLCMRVLKRIKAHLADEGLTESEQLDMLSEIDRQRNG